MRYISITHMWLSIVMVAVIGCGASDGDQRDDNSSSEINTTQIYTLTVGQNGSADYQCDGVDDHIQINQALKAVHDHGGGIVHIEAGSYSLNAPLRIYSNTIVEGEDTNTTVLQLRDRSTLPNLTPLMVNAHFEESGEGTVERNITLRQFTFDGNKENNTDKTHYEGNSWFTAVAFMRTADIKIEHVHVVHSLNDAFQFQQCEAVAISHCFTSNIGHDGVYFIYSHNLEVSDSVFDLQANSGVRTDNSNHIHIHHNRIYSKEGYGNVGIEIAFRNPGDVLDDLLIENNTIERAPIVGITLYSNDPRYARQAIIRNNVILQSGSGDEPLESTGVNVLNIGETIIQNNTIFNCRGSGIRFGSEWYDEEGYTQSEYDRNATIVNNIITQNTAAGSMKIYGIENLSDHLTIHADYNNVWGNKTADYHGLNAGAHSISADPRFVDAPYNDDSGAQFYGRALDLYLKPESPAIDVGVTIEGVSVDREGAPRPQGEGYDMGAYER